jgi:cytochrome bd ubiquinol oxidase subunit I
LPYEFGSNRSRFFEVAGNVVGPLIGYEVLTAFSLEATFLGVLLFGWKHTPPRLQALPAVLIAVSTGMSAFWILSANSWISLEALRRAARCCADAAPPKAMRRAIPE